MHMHGTECTRLLSGDQRESVDSSLLRLFYHAKADLMSGALWIYTVTCGQYVYMKEIDTLSPACKRQRGNTVLRFHYGSEVWVSGRVSRLHNHPMNSLC